MDVVVQQSWTANYAFRKNILALVSRCELSNYSSAENRVTGQRLDVVRLRTVRHEEQKPEGDDVNGLAEFLILSHP